MGEVELKFLEFSRSLVDLAEDRGRLGEEEFGIVDNDKGTFSTQHFLARTPGQYAIETFPPEGMETGSGNLEQVGVLHRRQGSDKVIGAAVEDRLPFLDDVSLVVDERNLVHV